jgi:hypothetical protein
MDSPKIREAPTSPSAAGRGVVTAYDLAATHIAVHGLKLEPQELSVVLEREGFDASCQGVRQAILDNCVHPRAER